MINPPGVPTSAGLPGMWHFQCWGVGQSWQTRMSWSPPSSPLSRPSPPWPDNDFTLPSLGGWYRATHKHWRGEGSLSLSVKWGCWGYCQGLSGNWATLAWIKHTEAWGRVGHKQGLTAGGWGAGIRRQEHRKGTRRGYQSKALRSYIARLWVMFGSCSSQTHPPPSISWKAMPSTGSQTIIFAFFMPFCLWTSVYGVFLPVSLTCCPPNPISCPASIWVKSFPCCTDSCVQPVPPTSQPPTRGHSVVLLKHRTDPQNLWGLHSD